MSEDPKLVAERRESVGTSSAKKVRQNGGVPGCVYGHKQDTVSFVVKADELNPILATGHKVVDFSLDGKDEKVMIQDVQWDTYSKYVQHIDFLRVDENERVTTSVEIVLRGVAPGVMSGGILEQPHHELPIECPVIRLPENIVIRVSELQVGQAVHVGDLDLPKDCTSTLPAEEVLVHIVAPRGSDLEETDEATEPELVGGSKEDE